MLEKLMVADFTPLVGTEFQLVRQGEEPLGLRLEAATDLSARAPAAFRPPFSLWFTGPLSPVLPQKTYRLEHDALAPMEIFIVPRGPKGGRMEYEATFN